MKRKGARLGQHFLVAHWPAGKLADAAGIGANDTVLEIGPGKGALTRELVRRAGRTIAVEKDPELASKLASAFEKEIKEGRLLVKVGDVRSFEPASAGLKSGEYTLAANIPYYITGEIIRKFLESERKPKTMCLLVQKEVADRIVSEKESILSLSVKAFGTPKRVAVVGKECFRPRPSVDSAILSVGGISRAFFTDISEEAFFRFIKAGFAAKRKKLIGNLRAAYPTQTLEEAFGHCRIDKSARAENVPLNAWKCLLVRLSSPAH